MSLTTDEKKILLELKTSSDGLHVFTIFRRAGLSTASVAKALSSLQRRGLISGEAELYRLTASGVHALDSEIQRRESIPTSGKVSEFPEGNSQPYQSVPAIGINEFYLPRISELPKSLRQKLLPKE